MSETTPIVSLSPLFASHEHDIGILRKALLAYGNRLRLFDAWLCTCGSPECPMNAVETFPVEQLMAAMLHSWNPQENEHQAKADPDGRMALELKQYLLRFGETFDLFSCGCDNPDCPKLRVAEQDPYGVLEIVWDEWSSRTGKYHNMPTEADIEQVTALAERNIQFLNLFHARVLHTKMDSWRPVIDRQRAHQNTTWYREAVHIVQDGRRYWVKDYDDLPVIRKGLAIGLALVERLQLKPFEARDFLLALRAATQALMMFDICHAQACQALYETLEPVIPMNELRYQIATGTAFRSGPIRMATPPAA